MLTYLLTGIDTATEDKARVIHRQAIGPLTVISTGEGRLYPLIHRVINSSGNNVKGSLIEGMRTGKIERGKRPLPH